MTLSSLPAHHLMAKFSDKTITADTTTANEAYTALVNRTDLDGQKTRSSLDVQQPAGRLSSFDRRPGDADYWRDKLDEIPWPSSGRVGRQSEMEGGKRDFVYLDAESLATATKLGNGDVSEGIRKALKQAGEQ